MEKILFRTESYVTPSCKSYITLQNKERIAQKLHINGITIF